MTPRDKKQALRRVTTSAVRSKLAAESRDTLIREALEVGCSIREVAAEANLSPARIHQIRHGR